MLEEQKTALGAVFCVSLNSAKLSWVNTCAHMIKVQTLSLCVGVSTYILHVHEKTLQQNLLPLHDGLCRHSLGFFCTCCIGVTPGCRGGCVCLSVRWGIVAHLRILLYSLVHSPEDSGQGKGSYKIHREVSHCISGRSCVTSVARMSHYFCIYGINKRTKTSSIGKSWKSN